MRPSLSLFPSSDPHIINVAAQAKSVEVPYFSPQGATTKTNATLHSTIIRIPEPSHSRVTERNRTFSRHRTDSHDQISSRSTQQTANQGIHGTAGNVHPHPARSTSLENRRNVPRAWPAGECSGLAAPSSGSNASSAIVKDVAECPSGRNEIISRDPIKSTRRSLSASSDASTFVQSQDNLAIGTDPDSNAEDQIRSMFPTYNHEVPLASQLYIPTQHIPYRPHMSSSKVSKHTEAHFDRMRPGSGLELTRHSDLGKLWALSNDTSCKISECPSTFRLGLQPHVETLEHHASSQNPPAHQISFGSSPQQPFYSVRQCADSVDYLESEKNGAARPQQQELLILRHHPTRPEVLPLVHTLIEPPPHPSSRRAAYFQTRSLPDHCRDLEANAAASDEETYHIASIEPAVATLAALSKAAISPEASDLVEFDPDAVSPEARVLAEAAIKRAKHENSSDVWWSAAHADGGTYKLRHASLGMLEIVVQGRVPARFGKDSRSHQRGTSAKVSLLTVASAGTYRTDGGGGKERPHDWPVPELASLDVGSGHLEINTEEMSLLRDPFLLDTAVAAILAVVIAESIRCDDPAFKFAAPPLSLAQKRLAKARKTAKDGSKPQASDSWEQRSLPGPLRFLTSVLSLLFRSLLSITGLGLRLASKIIKGCAARFKGS